MSVEPMTPPVGDKPPKRGPGRPKGSKNKPKDPISQLENDSKGNGDKPPRKGPGRPKGSKTKKKQKEVTEAIEEALAEILTAPAMPCAFVGDDWGAKHFTQNGREFASRLAQFSERNSQFRAWCETLMNTESIMALALAAAAYTIPPLMHWNIIPGAEKVGIPKKQRKSKKNLTPNPSDATEWPDRPETTSDEDMYDNEGVIPDTPFFAEFSDDEQVTPPTFAEVPVS